MLLRKAFFLLDSLLSLSKTLDKYVFYEQNLLYVILKHFIQLKINLVMNVLPVID